MEIKDLPESRLVGRSSTADGLACLLKAAAGGLQEPDSGFYAMDIVNGGPSSSRILIWEEVPELKLEPVSLRKIVSADEMALELLSPAKLDEFRFPEGGNSENSNKGWEVRRIDVLGRYAVLVWASWVQAKTTRSR